ncbi:MAG TPA: 50S ribosomal protein L32 [Chloroflexota bacterium]|nr:50S ribosomal protein L32 [Chloroflexota bacterium]
MPAVPKKRTSHARQGDRRQHLRLKLAELNVCRQCRQPKVRHRICPTCGTYKGRQYIDFKEKTTNPRGGAQER